MTSIFSRTNGFLENVVQSKIHRESVSDLGMPMKQFLIVLDDASGSREGFYHPGENVSGRIIIESDQGIKTTGLQLLFYGKASTEWSEDYGRLRLPQRTKHYSDSVSYFNLVDNIFGVNVNNTNGEKDTHELEIPKGTAFYPFSFQLPTASQIPIPSSYQGAHGRIEYALEAILKRSLLLEDNFKTKLLINVVRLRDLTKEPELGCTVEYSRSKTFGRFWCSSGPLSVMARIERKAYSPGDMVLLEGEINNQSAQRVDTITAELVERSTFFGNSVSLKQCKKKSIEAERTLVQKVALRQIVQPFDTCGYKFEFQIPVGSFPNIGDCGIIQVDHLVEIQAHISGGWRKSLTLSCPLTIGALSLQSIEIGKESQSHVI